MLKSSNGQTPQFYNAWLIFQHGCFALQRTMVYAERQEYTDTLAGVTMMAEVMTEVVPFTSGDGFACNLIHARSAVPSTKGPVLVVHGAGTRANLFHTPVQVSLVDYLLAQGYDVWLENWRASIDLHPNRWTLDQAAVFDHPAAVKKVVAETGREEIKALVHCQGSTSFMMSAIAGLVPQVKVIVSNAVSLHPVVPAITKFKVGVSVPVLKHLTDYLNPQWCVHAPTLTAKAVKALVLLLHHECHNPVCKGVSFAYGTGFPALWDHGNLNDATHEWISGEFAQVPMAFFEQIVKSIGEGKLVPVEGKAELPRDFVAESPKTDARFAFFSGANNRCFLPESQERTFAYFDGLRKDYHTLTLLPGYGHLDVFIGKNAATDVFPLMCQELERAN